MVLKMIAPILSGKTLTLKLYNSAGSIVNGSGDSFTESSGVFSATVAETLTGWHTGVVFEESSPVAQFEIKMAGADDLTVNESSQVAGSLSVGNIVALIGSGSLERSKRLKPLTLCVDESGFELTVSAIDADGSPVDLGDWDGPFTFRAVDSEGNELQETTGIVADGTTFPLTPASTLTASPTSPGKLHKWSLRDSTSEVVLRGTIEVEDVP